MPPQYHRKSLLNWTTIRRPTSSSVQVNCSTTRGILLFCLGISLSERQWGNWEWFTSLFNNLQDTDYLQLLDCLVLWTFDERRNWSDLIEVLDSTKAQLQFHSNHSLFSTPQDASDATRWKSPNKVAEKIFGSTFSPTKLSTDGTVYRNILSKPLQLTSLRTDYRKWDQRRWGSLRTTDVRQSSRSCFRLRTRVMERHQLRPYLVSYLVRTQFQYSDHVQRKCCIQHSKSH